ncbi:MAG TPA: hypothetical protein VFE19_08105 [Jatrophihabitantaceae bacterium]|nr:hypothetical protein [Jatrophihabitantaceae bacterium]
MTTSQPALTAPLAQAIADAEQLIAAAPHVQTEQDLQEGYDYLAGMVRQSLAASWSYDKDFPYFVRSATPYTKIGLDNPDTLYFSANIRDDAEYVVTGRRGMSTDLSFQILNGNYTPAEVPDSLHAFDDRDIEINADGSFELHFGPPREDAGPNYFALGPKAAMLLAREVFSDWTAAPGRLRIQQVDRIGVAPPSPPPDLSAKRLAAAAKSLVTQLKTFLAFPEWFYLKLPVNTMTEPRLTPGGLATQYSSAGHYELDEDQALVVTVPVSDAPYQGFQLGTMWYLSMDFANHQTSLTADQARHDPDAMMRFVVSHRDPGIVNWLECAGHRRGYLQIRWQRTSREFTAADGPTVEVVEFDSVAKHLPFDQAVTPAAWRTRIAARQAAVADRMLG